VAGLSYYVNKSWVIGLDLNYMSENIRSFEDLECWAVSRELRIFIAKTILPLLPAHEKHRLADQMLRAARSVTANIAEGYGRFHYADNAKFCSNARGSCFEVIDHLIAGNDEGLINEQVCNQGKDMAYKAIKLINGYMKYLKEAAHKAS